MIPFLALIQRDRYMTGSNQYLPIFDPVQDTFHSLRVRFPFCYYVVLAIAARAESGAEVSDEAARNLWHTCQAEARRYAGESPLRPILLLLH